MRTILSTGAVLFLFLGASSICLACDCVTYSASESFRQADSVFEGEVIRVVEAGSETTFTFRVDRSFKGTNMAEVVIVEGQSNCDYQFSLDTVYWVYARRFEDRLVSGACSGNQVVRTTSTLRSVSSSASFYQYVVPILGAALLLCLIVWFWPKNGRRRAA